ncbi:MAG: hypothetical protein HY510_03060 [Acidobacteria bacterium]|nr:hypothetical protein [Acidobacteriota bacterium]
MGKMRSAARGAVAALAALLVLGGVALAGPPRDRPAGGRPAGDEGLGGPPRPDEMREAMEQLMIVRMKKTLNLSADQEARVVPRVQALLEARREHASRRRAALLQLRTLMRSESAEDEEIGQALKEVQSIERDFRKQEEDLRTEMNGSLAPRQQAQMMFFEERFRRFMQRRMQEAMGQRPHPGEGPQWRRPGGPPPRGRRPGVPPADDFPGDLDLPEEDE